MKFFVPLEFDDFLLSGLSWQTFQITPKLLKTVASLPSQVTLCMICHVILGKTHSRGRTKSTRNCIAKVWDSKTLFFSSVSCGFAKPIVPTNDIYSHILLCHLMILLAMISEWFLSLSTCLL